MILGGYAVAADMEETWRLWATIEAWWPEIETLITHRVTNARTEAANTGIKHIKRTGRGYRNPAHYQAPRVVTVDPRRDGSAADAKTVCYSNGDGGCIASELAPRWYRCFVGDNLYDPCFASPANTTDYLCAPASEAKPWILIKGSSRDTGYENTDPPAVAMCSESSWPTVLHAADRVDQDQREYPDIPVGSGTAPAARSELSTRSGACARARRRRSTLSIRQRSLEGGRSRREGHAGAPSRPQTASSDGCQSH